MAGTFAAKVARALILTHSLRPVRVVVRTRATRTADLGAGEDEDDERREDMAPPSVDDVDALEIGDRMNVETLVEEAREPRATPASSPRAISSSSTSVVANHSTNSTSRRATARALFAGAPRRCRPPSSSTTQDNARARLQRRSQTQLSSHTVLPGHSTSPSRRSSTVVRPAPFGAFPPLRPARRRRRRRHARDASR